jgi:hypothetical protein
LHASDAVFAERKAREYASFVADLRLAARLLAA